MVDVQQRNRQMISAVSGGSTLPREVLQWLDGLDLSYSIRNPRRDLANGFIVAQMLTRHYPSELSILTFYNAQKKDRKIDNWRQIQKFLAKRKFKITQQEYESITNLGPESAVVLLFRLYEFFTGQKLNTDRRLASTMPLPQQPLYKRPTASYVAKDRELDRVVDNKEKEMRTKAMMTQQKNMIHTQKYNTGLIEWLIDKRKEEIQQEVNRQKEEIEKRTKSFVNSESKVEVREIELKCFNSSTSKKPRGELGDFTENKGVLDFLGESAALLVKKESIANDLKKFGIEVKEKQGAGINLVAELFGRCAQQDPKGNRKVTPDTLNRLLQLFRKSSEVNMVVDNIYNNFVDFRKFFALFYLPMRIYDRETETYKLILGLFSSVARGLHKHDSETAQMLFEEILLPELLSIARNEYKKAAISHLCLEFVRKESESYFTLVQRIKELTAGDLRFYISLLAHLIEKISRDCEDITYTLWSEFFYYGFLGLNSPAPTVRLHAAKILSRLFSDVVVANNEIINEKLPALSKLVNDPWWEVRAQALIIFKAILLSKHKAQSQSQDPSINDDLNNKTILNCITQVFKPDVSHNILRIGLIQLAELINFEESLCSRYLEVLLHVGGQIRSDVLNAALIKFGPVVYGACTFTYKLTGAPLEWNSLGIARVLSEHIAAQGQDAALSQAHLQILHSTLSKAGNFIPNYPEWLRIYQEFKQRIFSTLIDGELCQLGGSIIREFMDIKEIHQDIVTASRSELVGLLGRVYGTAGEQAVRDNLLELFEFLKKEEAEYAYRIVKDFAEREKSKYLSSNLVDFMNELTRQRRQRLFSQ